MCRYNKEKKQDIHILWTLRCKFSKVPIELIGSIYLNYVCNSGESFDTTAVNAAQSNGMD